MSINTEIETGLPPYPYPGLRPFGDKEAAIFFGRDEQIDALLELLEQNRFLAVVGPSGCGKSSLVRAGMIPALEAGFMASASFQWHVAVMHPGNQPIRHLSQALLESTLFESDSPDNQEDAAFLQATLRRGPLGLIEAVRNTPLTHGQNLLLVVDQFEEIFRFNEKGDPNEARAFVDLLLASAKEREFSIYVVITMRSDFLGNCPIFSGLPEAMNNSQFLTPRLTREQNRLAIDCPANLFDTTIEEKVITRILNEMGSDPDQLPLMQHLLMRMWRHATIKRSELKTEESIRLTLEDYHAAGGLKNALSSHVQAIYNQLDDKTDSNKRKLIAEMLFRQLTEITTEGQIIRRFVTPSEVSRSADVDEEAVISVIDEFRAEGRSFLMPSMTDVPELTSTTPIDISHESLIRQWQLLEDWTEDEAKARHTESMLKERAARWKDKGRGQSPNVERDYVLSGVDLAQALKWEKAHLHEIEWDDWKLEHEFLRKSEFFRDRAIRQEETAKHAKVIQENANELKRKHDQLREVTNRLREKSVFLGIAVFIAFLFLLIMVYALYSAYEQEREAEELRKKAEDLLNDTNSSTRVQKILSEAAKVDDPEHSFLLGVEARHVLDSHSYADKQLKNNTESLIGTFLDRTLRKFETSGIDRQILPGHEDTISSVVISPDGNWLVTASYDTTARLWDLTKINNSNSEAIILRGHTDRIYDVAFSPNGKHLVTVSGDRTARLWNLLDIRNNGDSPATPQKVFFHTGRIYHVDLSDRWLLAGSDNGNVQLWDLNDLNQAPKLLDGHKNEITTLAISPDNNFFVTGGSDSQIFLWDTKGKKYENLSTALSSKIFGAIKVTHFFFDSDSERKYLLIGVSRSTSQIWDLTKLYIKHTDKLVPDPDSIELDHVKLKNDYPAIGIAAFNPKTNLLVSGNIIGQINLWNLDELDFNSQDFAPALSFQNQHSGSLKRLEFTADGKWLATASDDSSVLLWKIKKQDLAKKQIPEPIRLTGHKEVVTSIRLSPVDYKNREKTHWLITGDREGKVVLWNLDKENSLIREPKSYMKYAAFSKDGNQFSAVGNDGLIRSWRIQSEPIKNFKIHSQSTKGSDYPGLRSIAMSDNSNWLATGYYDGRILVHDMKNNNPSIVLKCSTSVNEIQFSKKSPDRLICGNHDATATIWDFSPEKEAKKSWTLEGHEDKIIDVALSPDDQWAATAAFDSVAPVRLWKLDTDIPFPEPINLSSHSTTVTHVEFGHALQEHSQAGALLATGSNDGSVRLFTILNNSKPDKPRVVVEAPTKPGTITGLCFSANNHWLAAGNSAGELHLINVAVPDSEPIVCVGHTKQIEVFEYSADNRWLVTGCQKGELCLWDLIQLETSTQEHTKITPVARFTEHVSGTSSNNPGDCKILAVKFRKRNQNYELLSAGYDGTVRSRIAKPDPPLSSLATRASKKIGRNLTAQEWQDFIALTKPKNIEYHKTFDNMPVHSSNLERPKILARSGKIDKAIQDLRKLLVLNGIKPEIAAKEAKETIYIEYGRQLAKENRVEDAQTAFEQAGYHSNDSTTEINRLRAPTLVQEGRNLARKGKVDAALQLLQQARKYDPELLSDLNSVVEEVLREQITKHWKAGRSDNAITTFDILTKKFPHSQFKPENEAKNIIEYVRWVGRGSQSPAEMTKLLRLAQKFDSSLDFVPDKEAKLIRANFLISEARNLSNRGEMDESRKKLEEAKNLNPSLNIEFIRKGIQLRSLTEKTNNFVNKRQINDTNRNELIRKVEETIKTDPQFHYESALRPVYQDLIKGAKRSAQYGEIEKAILQLKQAKDLDTNHIFSGPFEPEELAKRFGINHSIRELLYKSQIQDALNLYNNTREADPFIEISSDTMNHLAWYGLLSERAQDVKDIAERLVTLEPANEHFRDTHALVQAYSGSNDIAGIIRDFESLTNSPDALSNSDSNRQKLLKHRVTWIKRLRDGEKAKDIFTTELLDKLREEEASKEFLRHWKERSTAPATTD